MTFQFFPIRGAVAALALLAAAPASAQMIQNIANTQIADELANHLRAITADPKDVAALIGAGEGALALGDVNAAVGFFARAEELEPRNGRAKAGLARVMLRFENPREALKLFDDATDHGVPDAEVAGDRGLAYDLRGDTRRAQRDYALALSRGADDEVTRRLALSLGISGDRDRALALLDPLLYKRDQGAWRARAFVLAMTGDQAGANQIVGQVLPEEQAGTMRSFLARLPRLRDAQKAMAVHLGRFPSEGRQAAVPTAREARRQGAADRLIPTGAPLGTEGAERARIVTKPDPREETTPAVAAVPPPDTPAERQNRLAAIIGSLDISAESAKAETPAQSSARHWAQLASGANRGALPREWRRLAERAPTLFDGKTAWTAPLRASNRLLAGPFDSASDAQAFVNALKAEGIAAFAWTSAAGQEIERLTLR